MRNKITYEEVLARANVLFKNYVQETYQKSHPDLDMNLVEVQVDTSVESLIKALVEVLNENK